MHIVYVRMLIDSYVISGDTCRHLEDDISVGKIVRELRGDTISNIVLHATRNGGCSFREDSFSLTHSGANHLIVHLR